MSRTLQLVSISLLASALAACGGSGGGSAETHTAGLRQGASGPTAPPTAVSHIAVVQSLYLAYFARPPDTAGFLFWNVAFDKLNLPTTPAELLAAYIDNSFTKMIVDGFVSSPEAVNINAGSDAEFVNTIYLNVFSRSADTGGRQYWVGQLESKAITRPLLALAIMAGAQADDQLAMSKKTEVTTRYLTALAAANVQNEAPLTDVGRDLLAKVNKDTDLAAFQATIAAAVLEQKNTKPGYRAAYTGFQDLYSDVGTSVQYRYTYGSGIVPSFGGELVFGLGEREIDFGESAGPGSAIAYRGQITASASVSASGDGRVPTLLMLCQSPSGSAKPFKSTDVLVNNTSKVLLTAADLAGQTLTTQREDCAAQSGASITFDAAGNATVTTSAGSSVYPAASVNKALKADLYNFDALTRTSWRAYRYTKTDGSFTYAIVSNVIPTPMVTGMPPQPAGALSLWSQE
ncbi:DUF4214 domain-containing protein [Rugamonas rivuli]|nr:DUF4214 domain-containing protein [Rugamonas rivuli]